MEGDQFGDLGSVPPVIFSEHVHASGDVQLAVWRSGGLEVRRDALLVDWKRAEQIPFAEE